MRRRFSGWRPGSPRAGFATTTAALLVVIFVLLGAVAYLGTRPTSSGMSTSMSGCPSASMEPTSSSTPSTPEISQNATTTDYKLMLEVSPPEQMLQMCQFTTQTSGMVMLAGSMSTMQGNMSSSSSMNQYHLVVHVYDLTTGATVIPQVGSVSIAVTNSSGMSMAVAVVEMFDAGQGPTSTHYGNNVELAAGSYTVTVTVMGQEATFDVTLS